LRLEASKVKKRFKGRAAKIRKLQSEINHLEMYIRISHKDINGFMLRIQKLKGELKELGVEDHKDK
jgi:hypothetical protein